jgi:hypothetical protein
MKGVYEAISEDLTNLGGPMGTESVSDNWRKLFDSVEKAKEYCEKDYAKITKGAHPTRVSKIKWSKRKEGFQTQDLLFVMYYITKKKVD